MILTFSLRQKKTGDGLTNRTLISFLGDNMNGNFEVASLSIALIVLIVALLVSNNLWILIPIIVCILAITSWIDRGNNS